MAKEKRIGWCSCCSRRYYHSGLPRSFFGAKSTDRKRGLCVSIENFEGNSRSQEHRTGEAREDSRRNWCSAGSRGSISVARRSIGSQGRFNTGAGSASSLARSGAWFFPEGDKVIGEIAAAGCRSQPGEKSEYKIAGKPMPSRRKGELPCQPQANKKEKRIQRSTRELPSARPEVAVARKAKATGEGPN